ncbi:MAG TPA: hypothetical protein VLB76_03805 [Thermoanaerobaculia bacterium]|nr:hypothetical protein [Thermoanaerobaculia bacterium]
MRGETAPRETREIVRHLLRGCLGCTGITGRLWDLAEPGPRLDSRPPRIHAGGPQGRTNMTGLEIAIDQIGDIAREVENLQFRLLGVQATLPESTAESVRLLDVDPMDEATEIHALIDCVQRPDRTRAPGVAQAGGEEKMTPGGFDVLRPNGPPSLSPGPRPGSRYRVGVAA